MGVVGRWGCALGTGHSLSIHLDVTGQYLVTACVYPDWDEDVVADEVAAEDEAELTVRGEWRMLSPTVISLDLEGAEVTEKYGAETAVAALPISKGMLFATASAMTDPTLALREAMAKIGLESAGLGSLAARYYEEPPRFETFDERAAYEQASGNVDMCEKLEMILVHPEHGLQTYSFCFHTTPRGDEGEEEAE